MVCDNQLFLIPKNNYFSHHTGFFSLYKKHKCHHCLLNSWIESFLLFCVNVAQIMSYTSAFYYKIKLKHLLDVSFCSEGLSCSRISLWYTHIFPSLWRFSCCSRPLLCCGSWTLLQWQVRSFKCVCLFSWVWSLRTLKFELTVTFSNNKRAFCSFSVFYPLSLCLIISQREWKM